MDRPRHMKTWATLWDTWQNFWKSGWVSMHGRWGVRDIEEVSLKWMFFEFYGTITQIGCTRNHREQCLHALCTCYLLGNLCCTVELFSSVCVCVCARAHLFVCFTVTEVTLPSFYSCSIFSGFSPQKMSTLR